MAVTLTNYKSFHTSDKIMNHKVEAQISPNIVPCSITLSPLIITIVVESLFLRHQEEIMI